MLDTTNPAPAAPAPAPAPAAEPVTQSAAHAAVASGSTREFRAARRAERAGTPLPAVTATAAPEPVTDTNTPAPTTGTPAPAPAPVDPQLSKRQQEANERTRRAVEAATADLRRELDAVRAQLPKPAATTPPAAPTPSEPAWKKYHDHPDAPKLADFDSLSEHSAAMAHFVMEQANAERAQASQQQELTSAQQARAGKFVEQLQAAKVADPEFTNKLTPEVRALKPFSGLQPGEGAGPLNVVAEQVFDSPIAPKVLLHFSQHPEDLRRLATVPEHLRSLPAAAQAEQHIQWIVREFGKLEGRLETPATPGPAPLKTLTEAPAPPTTLGTRPAEAADPMAAAIRNGDTSAYRRMRREQRAAGVRR